MVKNRAQNGPKSFKIEVWGSLGALWEPSWRPSGAGATTRAQKIKKYAIFESPRSSKMDKKSIKNHTKNCNIEKLLQTKDNLIKKNIKELEEIENN